jgi:hypothetical protein
MSDTTPTIKRKATAKPFLSSLHINTNLFSHTTSASAPASASEDEVTEDAPPLVRIASGAPDSASPAVPLTGDSVSASPGVSEPVSAANSEVSNDEKAPAPAEVAEEPKIIMISSRGSLFNSVAVVAAAAEHAQAAVEADTSNMSATMRILTGEPLVHLIFGAFIDTLGVDRLDAKDDVDTPKNKRRIQIEDDKDHGDTEKNVLNKNMHKVISCLASLESKQQLCSCKSSKSSCAMYRYRTFLSRGVNDLLEQIIELPEASLDLHILCLKMSAVMNRLNGFASKCKGKVSIATSKDMEPTELHVLCARYTQLYQARKKELPSRLIDLFFAFAVGDVDILTQDVVKRATVFIMSQKLMYPNMLEVILDALNLCEISAKRNGFTAMNLMFASNADNGKIAATSEEWHRKLIRMIVRSYKFNSVASVSSFEDDKMAIRSRGSSMQDLSDPESDVQTLKSPRNGVGFTSSEEIDVIDEVKEYIEEDDNLVDEQIFEQAKEIFLLEINSLSIVATSAMQSFTDERKTDSYLRGLMNTMRAQGANSNDMDAISRVVFFSILKRVSGLPSKALQDPESLIWKNFRNFLLIILDFIFHFSSGAVALHLDRECKLPDTILVYAIVKFLQPRMTHESFKSVIKHADEPGSFAHLYDTFKETRAFLEQTFNQDKSEEKDVQPEEICIKLADHLVHYSKHHFTNSNSVSRKIGHTFKRKTSNLMIKFKSSTKDVHTTADSKESDQASSTQGVSEETMTIVAYLTAFMDRVSAFLATKTAVETRPVSLSATASEVIVTSMHREAARQARKRRKESMDSSKFAQNILNAAVEREGIIR